MPLSSPFLRELASARTVLLAGMGGGYDVFSALPLFFALQWEGKTVHLANLSFSDLSQVVGPRLSPALVRVQAHTRGPHPYFPEMYLSRWFREHEGVDQPIWCFERTGLRPVVAAYQALHRELNFDAVVLVDGGTDSLMRGDEEGLGTPQEDMVSLLAVEQLDVPLKLLTSVAFGVDAFHGINHALFLEAVAELTRSGDFLGCFSLQREMPEVAKLRAAALSVFQAMPRRESIVVSSLLAALEGRFGDAHSIARTEGAKLWINALMPLCWNFRVSGIAARLLYREELRTTETYDDVTRTIREFRSRLATTRPGYAMPL